MFIATIYRKFNVLLSMLAIITSFGSVWSQEVKANEDFYFDAVVFKGEKLDSSRIDVYVVVPNERLNFVKSDDGYNAVYELIIATTSTTLSVPKMQKFEKNVSAKTYNESLGGNAEWSSIQTQTYLLPGKYRIKATLKDIVSGREYEKSREITVLDNNAYPFVTSSIMLISGIEEDNGKYIITPHISDNIGTLTEGYFCFFEVYNSRDGRDIDIKTKIIDVSKNNADIYIDVITKKIENGTNQIYVRIPNGINYGLNTNIIRIEFSEAQNILANAPNSDIPIIAAVERSIKCASFLLNRISIDLSQAIKQLRYVATETEINSIDSGSTDNDKLLRFIKFWKKLDPSLNTERNEAMEEYYARIDYANKNFKAYSEGWLTDKGHIYIVFGTPMNVERSNRSYADNRTYEQWTYGNNRTFIFVDVSGFGDFRLYSPTLITDKFEY
jgi:GWxTD domain-containing protein